VRNKPDISAADGVSTVDAGLCAVLRHVGRGATAAAIAALVKQAAPNFTPAQIRRC
jgi:hypothetical protein